MEYLIEKERTLPVSDRCDVLVAGGGIAGIAAAVAASRGGAKELILPAAKNTVLRRSTILICSPPRLNSFFRRSV